MKVFLVFNGIFWWKLIPPPSIFKLMAGRASGKGRWASLTPSTCIYLKIFINAFTFCHGWERWNYTCSCTCLRFLLLLPEGGHVRKESPLKHSKHHAAYTTMFHHFAITIETGYVACCLPRKGKQRGGFGHCFTPVVAISFIWKCLLILDATWREDRPSFSIWILKKKELQCTLTCHAFALNNEVTMLQQKVLYFSSHVEGVGMLGIILVWMENSIGIWFCWNLF